MERRISIKDIAKEAKVSIGSASQALNGRRNTSDELRRAVELAAKRLGYEKAPLERRRGPRPGAKMSARRKGRTIVFATQGVISISNNVYASLLQGVEETSERRGCSLLLRRFRGSEAPSFQDADGCLVLSGIPISNPHGAQAVGMMGPLSQFHGMCQVSYDNPATGEIAARRLLEKGRSKLAVFSFSSPKGGTFCERVETFKKTAEANGASVEVHFGSDFGTLERLFAPVVERFDEYDGVFCASDLVCFKLYLLFPRFGLTPGRDFDIVSCDNTPQLAEAFSPPPDEIDIHARQVGARAVEALINRLEDPSAPLERSLIAPELVPASTIAKEIAK